jgi:hypothetical protein
MRWAIGLVIACGCDSTPSLCSDPYNIGFGSMTDLLAGPPPVAVGGSYLTAPRCSTPGHSVVVLDHAYDVDDLGGPAVRAERVDDGIRLTGVQAGTSRLQVSTDDTSRVFTVQARVVDQIGFMLDGARYYVRTEPFAWTPGRHTLDFALYGMHTELHDDAATLTGPRVSKPQGQPYEADAVDGEDLALTVHGGSQTFELAIPISATADTIELQRASELHAGRTSPICFVARYANVGMIGVTFAFTGDGDPAPAPYQDSPECARVTPASDATKVTLTVTAAGRSLTVEQPVLP